VAFEAPADVPRAVVAEGVVGNWPWQLEAWRRGRQLYWVVHHRDDPESHKFKVDIGETPAKAEFFQDPDSDASVLCGPIDPAAEDVQVERLLPEADTITELAVVEGGGGRFFVCPFESRVRQAMVHLAPKDRFRDPRAFAVNWELDRRIWREGSVLIGEGFTQDQRWRLRLLVDPDRADHVQLGLVAAQDPRHLERLEAMGGSGYGAPLRDLSSTPVFVSCYGGGSGSYQVIGEVAGEVHSVTLKTDAGEIDAEIVRTDVVPNDYFVGLAPATSRVNAVVARDGEGNELAQVPVGQS
jgi:hypothetical protein